MSTTKRIVSLLIPLMLFVFLLSFMGAEHARALSAGFVKIKLNDAFCTTGVGPTVETPTGDNIWTSDYYSGFNGWATDDDKLDPDCVKIWLDNSIPQQLDFRICIKMQDYNRPFGPNVYGTPQCTNWASDIAAGAATWSGWASDNDDIWAIDGISIKVDTRSMPGRYISNMALGWQNSKATNKVCGSGNGNEAYTPDMNAGGGWSSPWASDGSESSIACSRIRLFNVSIVGMPCTFNGAPVSSGTTVYNAAAAPSVPFDSSCAYENRTCTNGVLSGSYAYPTCSVGAPANCSLNGVSAVHNGYGTFYSQSTLPYGTVCGAGNSPYAENRLCYNGSYTTGSYTVGSCNVAAPANCTLPGDLYPVAHGATVTAYQSSSVPYGQLCSASSQSRTCNNGSFTSGSYTFGNCSPAAPANCTLPGDLYPVAHGATVTAYQSSSVPYGQSCAAQSQSRTCNNGSFTSGSYTFGNCSSDSSQQPLVFTANGFATSTTVRKGSSVRLAWNGVNSSNCSVNGIGGFVSTSSPIIPTNTNPAPITGSTWVQINTKSLFTLRCTLPSSKELTSTVNIIPEQIEI